jgi:hypothetical protein
LIGKDVRAVSERLTLRAWADILAEVTGKKVATLNVSVEDFEDGTELKKVASEEVYLQFLAFHRGLVLVDLGRVPVFTAYIWYRLIHRNVEESKAVYPDQWDTRAWAKQSEELKAIVGI